MKKLTPNALFMALVLSLSLAACGKNKTEEKKPSPSNGQSQQNPQDKDKDNKDSQSDDLSPKEPHIGDQCSPYFFSERCSGKDLLFCDEVRAGNSYIYVVAKEECADSCAAITAFGETAYKCVNNNNLFDSCLEAIKAELGDDDTVSDEAPNACSSATPDENGKIGMEEAFLPNNDPVYILEWGYCTKVGNKYYLLDARDICHTCAINSDYSYTCEQNDTITGANLKEGDKCGSGNFVPRRLDNKSALVCDEDRDTADIVVKKVSCTGDLELAFQLEPWETFDRYYKGREPFCINTQEPACKADIFTCVANDDGTTDSYLLKGCADTDKGRHFVTKESVLTDSNAFTSPMVCGAKGCNQATGMCNK